MLSDRHTGAPVAVPFLVIWESKIEQIETLIQLQKNTIQETIVTLRRYATDYPPLSELQELLAVDVATSPPEQIIKLIRLVKNANLNPDIKMLIELLDVSEIEKLPNYFPTIVEEENPLVKLQLMHDQAVLKADLERSQIHFQAQMEESNQLLQLLNKNQLHRLNEIEQLKLAIKADIQAKYQPLLAQHDSEQERLKAQRLAEQQLMQKEVHSKKLLDQEKQLTQANINKAKQLITLANADTSRTIQQFIAQAKAQIKPVIHFKLNRYNAEFVRKYAEEYYLCLAEYRKLLTDNHPSFNIHIHANPKDHTDVRAEEYSRLNFRMMTLNHLLDLQGIAGTDIDTSTLIELKAAVMNLQGLVCRAIEHSKAGLEPTVSRIAIDHFTDAIYVPALVQEHPTTFHVPPQADLQRTPSMIIDATQQRVKLDAMLADESLRPLSKISLLCNIAATLQDNRNFKASLTYLDKIPDILNTIDFDELDVEDKKIVAAYYDTAACSCGHVENREKATEALFSAIASWPDSINILINLALTMSKVNRKDALEQAETLLKAYFETTNTTIPIALACARADINIKLAVLHREESLHDTTKVNNYIEAAQRSLQAAETESAITANPRYSQNFKLHSLATVYRHRGNLAFLQGDAQLANDLHTKALGYRLLIIEPQNCKQKFSQGCLKINPDKPIPLRALLFGPNQQSKASMIVPAPTLLREKSLIRKSSMSTSTN